MATKILVLTGSDTALLLNGTKPLYLSQFGYKRAWIFWCLGFNHIRCTKVLGTHIQRTTNNFENYRHKRRFQSNWRRMAKIWNHDSYSIYKTKLEDNLDVSLAHVVTRNAQANILFSKDWITLNLELKLWHGWEIVVVITFPDIGHS